MLGAYDDRSIPAPLMDADFFRIVAMQNVYTPQVDPPTLAAATQAAFGQIDAYRVGQSVVPAAYQGARRDPAELAAQACRCTHRDQQQPADADGPRCRRVVARADR